VATKVKVVSFSLPKPTVRAIDQLAAAEGRSRSSFVARELARVIAERPKGLAA
jgi:metal-responsive CopG/Arc/MetJ family transcriptional regulator